MYDDTTPPGRYSHATPHSGVTRRCLVSHPLRGHHDGGTECRTSTGGDSEAEGATGATKESGVDVLDLLMISVDFPGISTFKSTYIADILGIGFEVCFVKSSTNGPRLMEIKPSNGEILGTARSGPVIFKNDPKLNKYFFLEDNDNKVGDVCEGT